MEHQSIESENLTNNRQYHGNGARHRGKLLITNRKSHLSFRFVLKSVTLNDLERRNDHFQVTRTEMTKDQTGSVLE